MRIAFISDLHGNLLAFEAVLAELEQEPIDRLVCLGDVVFGPQPHETLARLRELDCPVIMGNWDYWSINGMPEADDEVGIRLMEIGAWWAKLLTDDDRRYIETFQPTLELQVDEETNILCFHGSPNSFEDWIFATTSEEELTTMFAGTEASVLVGGHTHLQMVRRWDDSIIVNPGSVGQPFRHWWPKTVRVAPWAEYGLLSIGEGHLAIDLRRTTFDVEALQRSFLESGMPYAEWWASTWSDESEALTLESPTRPPARREPKPTRSRATR